MHFQGLDPFGAESVSGSASGKGLACVFEDVGADLGTHWNSIYVLGGCVFYEFGMFQDYFLVILARFCGYGISRVAGGRQEAHPDAK